MAAHGRRNVVGQGQDDVVVAVGSVCTTSTERGSSLHDLVSRERYVFRLIVFIFVEAGGWVAGDR